VTRVLLVSTLLFGLLLPGLALADDPPAVAILDLSNDTGDASFDSAGPGVAAILLTKFTKTSALRVVERSALQAITDEIDLGATGLVDPSTAAKAGKLVGADYVVAGSLFTVKLPSIAVSVRIVDVETGEVVAAEEVVGEVGERGEEFFVLVDELAYLVLDAVEVRLGSKDRIEFGQIDVRNLETVGLFGSALQALDRGDNDAAEGLLGRALALEPGFTLAAETLASIAADISARRTDVAHDSVLATRAVWDAIREATDGAPFEPDAGCKQAVRARLMLIEGEYAAYLEAEEARLAATIALLERTPSDDHGNLGSDFGSCWRATLQAAGADRIRTYQYNEKPFWPFDIKEDLADVRIRLGQTDTATAMIVDAWQDRGPQEEIHGRPAHPRGWAERNGLVDLAVVYQQERLRGAELRGDTKEAHSALDGLEEAVEVAQKRAESKRVWEVFVARLATEEASADLLKTESRSLGYVTKTMPAKYAAYRDFCRRVEDGYYDQVRAADPRLFREVARSWRKIADSTWSNWWDLERKLSHLLTYHQQVPPANDEEAEKYREELERFVTGKFRP